MGSRRIIMSLGGALLGALTSLTASVSPSGLGEAPKVYHNETPVGAGFYAMRHNVSKGNVEYTKLVPKHRGRELTRKQIKANSKLWRDEAKRKGGFR